MKGIFHYFRRRETRVFFVPFGGVRDNYGLKWTGSSLLWLGSYHWVGDLAYAFAKSEEFPISADAGAVNIELVEMSLDLTASGILDEFARRGLERPTAEDALHFGAKYPDEQRERPIAFLHEPWADPAGNRGVLVLRGDKRSRGLALYWYDDRWYRGVLFAARRK